MGEASTWDVTNYIGESAENDFAALLGDGARIEVKRDLGCMTTGNIFVEFGYRPFAAEEEQPSGIAVTEADFWAIMYDEDCFLVVPVPRLVRLCRTAYRERGSVFGGDGKRSRGVLVRISDCVRPLQPEPDGG